MGNYDTDLLAWSEEQAALLRRVAAGERVNEASLDWPNIIEEIETVGRSELHAVESLLHQALAHLLKIEGWPGTKYVRSWQKEARVFRRQARRRFSASMRQHLDLAGIYQDALDVIPDFMDGQAPLPLPPVCPLTLDELLDPSQDLIPSQPFRAAGQS